MLLRESHGVETGSWQEFEAALLAFASIAKDLCDAPSREHPNGRALSSALVVAVTAALNTKLRAGWTPASLSETK